MKGRLKRFEDAIVEVDDQLYKWDQLKEKERDIYDELDWLNQLRNFLIKRKDLVLVHWIEMRIETVNTKIKNLNEQ